MLCMQLSEVLGVSTSIKLPLFIPMSNCYILLGRVCECHIGAAFPDSGCRHGTEY